MGKEGSGRRGLFRGIFHRRDKKRTVSLDETIGTSHLSHTDTDDCLDYSSGTNCCLRTRGPVSKATALLNQHRITNESLDGKLMKALQDENQASPVQHVASKKPLKSCLKAEASEETLDPSIRARQDAIRAQQRLLGTHHPDVLFSLESLVRFHRSRGEHREANLVVEEKQRLSRESYLYHFPGHSVPKSIVIIHEDS
jgi:hypothetical protein